MPQNSAEGDEVRSALGPMLEQIRTASQSGLYMVALISALIIPDICGALASPTGSANDSQYRSWIKKHCQPRSNLSDAIWDFRNSVLHEGSMKPRRGGRRLAFLVPTNGSYVDNVAMDMSDGKPLTIWISVLDFVEDIVAAAEVWLEKNAESQVVIRNLEKSARLHPNGYGLILGQAAIA
jgi:hypothetical protein